MGYRGKLHEQEAARTLRAEGLTMPEIALELGVSKGSVSLWTRDVPFDPRPRRLPVRNGPNRLEQAKAAEIAAMRDHGRASIGSLNDRDVFIAGLALYAGEGAKRDGAVSLANSNPRIVSFFCQWLRMCFEIDESRLRVALYLHEGLDLAAAVEHWSGVTSVPATQFTKPYRAVPDAGIRHNKHVHGCATVRYCCSRTHRTIMGQLDALLTSPLPTFRGSSIGGAGDC